MGNAVSFTTFRALEKKEVINCTTGERLGFVCDAEIDMSCGEIKYFIVPIQKDAFSFKAREWRKFSFSDISKIGDDIILITGALPCTPNVGKRKKLL